MHTRSFIAIICLAGAVTASAQALTTEITVDRTVVTELPDANPLKSVFPVMPQLPAPDFRLQAVQYSRPTTFGPLAGNLSAPLYTGISAPPDCRGYVLAGYFPTYNAEVAAGYRFVNTGSTQAGAALSFNGFSYKSKLSQHKTTVCSNTLSAQAYGAHRFGAGAQLTASVDYMYAGLKSPLFVSEPQKQSISAFGAKASVSGGKRIGYDVELRYSHFGLGKDILKYLSETFRPASDNRFGIKGTVTFALGSTGKTALDFGVGADFLKASGYGADILSLERTDETSGIISINPVLRHTDRRFSVKAGVLVNLGLNSPDKVFHIAPDVALCWTPSGMFDAYVTADGGEHFRDLRWQYEQSVFAPATTASTRSFTKLRSRVGFNLRLFNDLSFGGFAGHGHVNNLPVFFDGFSAMTGIVPRVPAIFTPERAKTWYYGANIGYDYRDVASISASARYYVRGDFEAADRARLVIDTRLRVRPIAPLTLELAYSMRADRRLLTPGDRTTNMHNSSLLDLTGSYAITERLSAFISVRNILNRRCMSTPTVESRPLNGLAGVSYLF